MEVVFFAIPSKVNATKPVCMQHMDARKRKATPDATPTRDGGL